MDILERAVSYDVGNVNKVGQGQWEVIEATVDSGAVDTVGPPGIAKAFPIVPTAASIAGKKYQADLARYKMKSAINIKKTRKKLTEI